jgi:hypothetical protein
MKRRFTATVRIETVHVEHVRRWVYAASAESARSEILRGNFEEDKVDSHVEPDTVEEITSQVEECK